MRKKFLIFMIFIALFITAFMISGCTKVSEEAISFADSATENILVALNNRDYENYKKDMDDTMLEAIPEEEFMKFSSYLTGTIGEYASDSKEIAGSTIQNEMIIIVYGASYTGEAEEVTINVVISESDEGDYKISGLWFDSPGLRENPYE